MKGNLLTLHRRFCLDSTVLGLKYFYLFPDKFSRFFWSAWVTFILYFAAVITYLLYMRFEALPTRINIENQFEPVAQLPYPAITLCTPNQMTISGVKHFDQTLVNGNRSYDLASELHQLLGFYYFTDNDPDQLIHLQELVELNRYTLPEVMMQLPQSCDQFLRMCIFRKRLIPNCQGLFKPLLTHHGLCCIFNSVYYYEKHRRNQRNVSFTPHLVEQSGVLNGLTVVTDYQPDDALDYTVQYAGAARIMFTDWTEFPADDESLLVSPASESFHMIHATATYCSPDVLALTDTSRKCLLEGERQLPFFHSYRNSDCDTLCVSRAVERQCGCLMLYLPHLRIREACGAPHIPCIKQVKLALQDWQNECDCPRDCDSRHYRVDSSFGNLDGLEYMFHRPYASIPINESRTSIMHFAFRASVYEKQKQETVMCVTILVSNLGGVFGLCLGCSVVSVLEVLFYNYSAGKHCARARRRATSRIDHQYRE